MPRPSPADKRKAELNGKRKQVVRETQAAREARQDKMIEGLISSALARPRTTAFDREAAMHEFDEARALCIAKGNGVGAARCTWFKAELCGLIVDRSIQVTATAADIAKMTGSVEQNEIDAIEKVRQRNGSKAASYFTKLLADMRADGFSLKGTKRDDNDDVIDAEPHD
jgi:hypothetical protein